LACRVIGNRLDWESAPATNVDVDTLFRPTTNDEREDRTEAERVITELLSTEDWPLDATVAIAAGKANGIADRTLRRTAKRMGIGIRRVNFGARGRWVWHKPAIAASSDRYDHQGPDVTPMAAMEDSQPKQGINGSHTHIEARQTAFTRARDTFVFDNDPFGTAGAK
jgi:hypothetical protein